MFKCTISFFFFECTIIAFELLCMRLYIVYKPICFMIVLRNKQFKCKHSICTVLVLFPIESLIVLLKLKYRSLILVTILEYTLHIVCIQTNGKICVSSNIINFIISSSIFQEVQQYRTKQEKSTLLTQKWNSYDQSLKIVEPLNCI